VASNKKTMRADATASLIMIAVASLSKTYIFRNLEIVCEPATYCYKSKFKLINWQQLVFAF